MLRRTTLSTDESSGGRANWQTYGKRNPARFDQPHCYFDPARAREALCYNPPLLIAN